MPPQRVVWQALRALPFGTYARNTGEGRDPLRSNGEGEVGLTGALESPASPQPSPPPGAEREVMFGGDDYAMMREVFRRRFGRALKEDPGRDLGQWPDLVLRFGTQLDTQTLNGGPTGES